MSLSKKERENISQDAKRFLYISSHSKSKSDQAHTLSYTTLISNPECWVINYCSRSQLSPVRRALAAPMVPLPLLPSTPRRCFNRARTNTGWGEKVWPAKLRPPTFSRSLCAATLPSFCRGGERKARLRRQESEGSERKTVLAGREEDGTINTQGCMLLFDFQGRRRSGAINYVGATGGLAVSSDQRRLITPRRGLTEQPRTVHTHSLLHLPFLWACEVVFLSVVFALEWISGIN